MTDAEFLDDLEARWTQPWSDEDTLRLYQLGPWRMPRAHIRQVYTRLSWRRKEMIKEVRFHITTKVIERLDE